MPDTLNYEDLKAFLNTKYIGRRVLYLESATSTNDIAKELALKGEKEGLIIIAEEQTKGRGRMGRKWSTGKGRAIAATILLRPDIQSKDAPSVTPVLALSIVQALKESEGIDVKIKWPNDIVLNDRKLSGILTEMNAEGEKINYVIAGMGLNVNQDNFEYEISDIAISLKMHSKKAHNRGEILASILNKFEINYDMFKTSGISALIGQLKDASILMDRKVTVKNLNEKFEAFILDMDCDGSLIGRLDNGKTIKILSGEISVMGLYDCTD